jgi:hypothetical protein
MASTRKEYNKRIEIEATTKSGKKVVDRSKCHLVMQEHTTKDGIKCKIASDRPYLVNEDGSLRSLKTKISKKERRRIREQKGMIDATGQVTE